MSRTLHGHRVGGRKSPTYISWDCMVARCCRPAHPFFPYYGGRGITVWPAWRGKGEFARFLADVGERPPGKTLDRIDVQGNYEPGNVQWATPREQRWNRSDFVTRPDEFPNDCDPPVPVSQPVGMPF